MAKKYFLSTKLKTKNKNRINLKEVIFFLKCSLNTYMFTCNCDYQNLYIKA